MTNVSQLWQALTCGGRCQPAAVDLQVSLWQAQSLALLLPSRVGKHQLAESRCWLLVAVVSKLSGVLTFSGGCQVGTTQTNTRQLKKFKNKVYIIQSTKQAVLASGGRSQQAVVDVNQLCAKPQQMSVNRLLTVVSTDWKIQANRNKCEVALAGVVELRQALAIGDKCSQAVAEVSQKCGGLECQLKVQKVSM